MKNTSSAFSGSLPRKAKIRKLVASMAAAAISGAAMRIAADGAARLSSRHCNGPHGSSGIYALLRGAGNHWRGAGHQQADRFDGELRAGMRRGQAARRQHGNSIADREQLVELFGNDQYGRAGIAQVDERSMNQLGGAAVPSPGRLGRQ